MCRFLALLSLLFFVASQPVQAAMVPTSLGSQKVAASTTNVLTTGADCPVGSLIVLIGSYTTIADTLSSVADSAGNTWQTPFDNIVGTGIGIGFAYAKNTTIDLPNAGTITATFAGSTVNAVAVVCVSNADPVAPLDTSNHSATGLAASAATTVNTGTLANATEIVIGGFTTATAMGASNLCNGSFSKTVSLSGTSPALDLCTLVVSSTGSVAFSPTWTTANNYASDVVSFQGVSVKSPSFGLTGVGP